MRPGWLAAPLLGAVLAGGTMHAQEPDFETTRIADGVYRFRYRVHNAFFVVTSEGVVAFDPISPTAADRYAAEIERVAPGSRLRAIVYSHRHADHASGAAVLRRALGVDVPIIAHANAHEPIRAAGDTSLPPPDVTFEERLTLHFGDRSIELHYLGKSHSDDMLVALLPDDRIAFAVDFASHDRIGYRDLGSFHFPDQFTALERLLALEFDVIVFGHGPVGDRHSVERQIRYYSDLREAVQSAVERGWSEDEAAERVRLPTYERWGGYDSWFPLNVRGMYRWLVRDRAR